MKQLHVVYGVTALGMSPALEDRRIPERIEPTPVVRARQSPNGQDLAILPYRGDERTHPLP